VIKIGGCQNNEFINLLDGFALKAEKCSSIS